MIDNTVLVVDADQETEEKIVSTLETEGYLVFTASGNDISAGMADKIQPLLIYLKHTSSTIEVCKTIHNIEKFKKAPIILLASLSETLDAKAYFYGIVDYLKMPVSLHELVEKTREILAIASDFKGTEENIGLFMKEETAPAEEPSQVKDEYSFDTQTDEISEIAQPNEEYSYHDEKEETMENLFKNRIQKRPYRFGFLTPFLVVMAAIVILAAGFFLYKLLIPVSVAVKPQKTVQHQEPAVLPPPEQQKQEQPVTEENPAVKNEVPKVSSGVNAPDAKVAEKPFYSVQLGAFKIKANAEALAKTYKEKGYEAFIHKGTAKGNKILYRVLIDKFENRKEAFQLAEDVRTKEKIQTTVFSGKAKYEIFQKTVPERGHVL
jgi:DNA-binding response OmpR family regulator